MDLFRPAQAVLLRMRGSATSLIWAVLFQAILVLGPATARADVPPSGLIMPMAMGRGLRLAPPTLSPPVMPNPAQAAGGETPGLLCRRAIAAAARNAGVPDHLMAAIGRVESGRRGADGVIHPWPWSINVEGADHVYDTREQAIAAVRSFQAQGLRSIDVGCMQVNLLHHPSAFASLEQAFDPAANAAYAARFLTDLFAQSGSWPRATAAYHSATPELGDPYQRKVMAVLGEETQSDQALLGPMAPGLARAGQRLAAIAPGTGGTIATATGAVMLGNRAEAAHIIPQPAGTQSRDLAAYRSRPVRVAGRGS